MYAELNAAVSLSLVDKKLWVNALLQLVLTITLKDVLLLELVSLFTYGTDVTIPIQENVNQLQLTIKKEIEMEGKK